MRRHRFVVLLLSVGALSGLAGCGAGGGDGAAERAVATTTPGAPNSVTQPPQPLDDTPFCVAARGLESLGREQAPPERSLAQALAQNERLAELIEIVAANAPADAPDALGELIADYRVLTAAITAADGDVEAAFEALDAEDPQLSVRLGLPDSYHGAVVLFADRCGTARPGA